MIAPADLALAGLYTPFLAVEFSDLVRVLAFVVFILAPVWRSIIEARKKEREKRARATSKPTTDEASVEVDEPMDLDPWEALLRGDSVQDAAPVETAAAPPVAPARPQTSPPRVSRPALRELDRGEPALAALPENEDELERGLSGEDLIESGFGSEDAAERGFLGESAMEGRVPVERPSLQEHAYDLPGSSKRVDRRRPRLRRTRLRDAIVWREVLGRPVALRSPDQPVGTPDSAR